MSESVSTNSTEPVVAAPMPNVPPSPPEIVVDPQEAQIATLTAQLEAARARVDELARAYQAGERDREAFKQRLQRERDQLLDVEKGKVALTLLETIDQLDLCLSAAEASPLADGVRMIREGIVKQAVASGIERVELEGAPYDPNLAEATDLQLVTEPAQDGLVMTVVRACYRLGGRVIRPGRVRVGKYVQPAQA